MQTYCLDLKEEDMPLRKEDKDWVADKIQAVVSEHLNPHGWRKAREFIPLAGILAVFIGLLALAGSGWNYAFSRVDKEARFEQSTTDNLSRINEALKLIPTQIAVAKFSSVSPQELKQHKDELASARNSLRSVPRNVPNFWPTTFQVITLLSQATSNPTTQNEQKEGVMDNVVSNSPNGVSPVTNSRVVLKNSVAGITFINSIVRFDPSVRLANDTFINCVFIFPSEANPPTNLQQIGSELLAADLSHAIIKGS